MLQSDLRDYSYAYTVVKGTINVTDPNNDAYDKKLALKNNAPFISCILIINNTLIDNAEHLDIVMLMYNMTEHSKHYSQSNRKLWIDCRDQPISGRYKLFHQRFKIF